MWTAHGGNNIYWHLHMGHGWRDRHQTQAIVAPDALTTPLHPHSCGQAPREILAHLEATRADKNARTHFNTSSYIYMPSLIISSFSSEVCHDLMKYKYVCLVWIQKNKIILFGRMVMAWWLSVMCLFWTIPSLSWELCGWWWVARGPGAN